MAQPHLVCVLEGSSDPVFRIDSFDYKIIEGDFIQHTVGGVTTNYLVERAVLEVETKTGDPEVTSNWTTVVLRVSVSVVP